MVIINHIKIAINWYKFLGSSISKKNFDKPNQRLNFICLTRLARSYISSHAIQSIILHVSTEEKLQRICFFLFSSVFSYYIGRNMSKQQLFFEKYNKFFSSWETSFLHFAWNKFKFKIIENVLSLHKILCFTSKSVKQEDAHNTTKH